MLNQPSTLSKQLNTSAAVDDTDKSIEIGEYLSAKIDTKRANALGFQRKILKFQTLYGLKLIDPNKVS
jgi:hypothetical protein